MVVNLPMNGFLKVSRLVLIFVVLLGLAGCASTQETTDDGSMNPDALPSKDDASHGWGPVGVGVEH